MKKIFILLVLFSLCCGRGKADTPISILGATTTQAGDIDAYILTPPIGARLVWTVSGGEIISGQGTPAIIVAWDDNNPGFVQANINNNAIVIIDTNSSIN